MYANFRPFSFQVIRPNVKDRLSKSFDARSDAQNGYYILSIVLGVLIMWRMRKQNTPTLALHGSFV